MGSRIQASDLLSAWAVSVDIQFQKDSKVPRMILIHKDGKGNRSINNELLVFRRLKFNNVLKNWGNYKGFKWFLKDLVLEKLKVIYKDLRCFRRRGLRGGMSAESLPKSITDPIPRFWSSLDG